MPKRKVRKRRVILYIFLLGVLGFVGFYGYRLIFLKGFAAQTQAQIAAQLEEARRALKNFDPETALDSFESIDSELNEVSDEVAKFGVLNATSFFGKFKTLPDTLKGLTGISGTAVHITEDIAYLKENATQLMLGGRGRELIERLVIFGDKLTTLANYVASVDADKDIFGADTAKKLALLSEQIEDSKAALSAVIDFLSRSEPQRLLVIFQNPSEQRPAGGFIGSYAVLTLTQANITEISVRDIYDPDGWVELKVIPPETLQLITDTWEARDANWFFDFPTSAKKVIYFLNNSRIYSEQNITFDGAIAINTDVLTNILKILGPIDLPEYDVVIDSENFLSFVQKEVEAGEDKKVNQPKKILQVLTPKILSKISELSDDGKRDLVKLFEYQISRKNIMVYLKDKKLQTYVKKFGMSGEVFKPSNRVVSEYLAVVNANIAGGKSDAVTSQTIDLASSISETGEITNKLTITRSHSGQNETEWWYRATNKNYFQIYTTVGSQAVASTGRDKWPTPVARNFKGFTTDPDVESIESTYVFLKNLGLDRFIAFDKTVFAGWLNTPAGKTKTLTLTYKNPRKLDPNAKIPYEFIFEKQSGASTSLSFSIEAPPGYKWKQVNSTTLKYESSDPPGQVRLRQTLIPIN